MILPTDAALVREALDAPRLTRDDIAARLGIRRGRLESYQYGTRAMPAELRRRLALVLDAQAAELRRLSGALLEADTRAGDDEGERARS